MNWKRFGDEQPLEGKLAVVFRYKQRRYYVVKFRFSIPQGNKAPAFKNAYCWDTESNKLTCNDDDHWTYIEPCTVTKTYE